MSLEQSAALLRKQLGSIDLSDIEKLKGIKLSKEDDMARAGDAETFYDSYFEIVIKIFIQKQLEWIGINATDSEKLAFGRGTFNGLILIKEWMEEQKRKSLSRFDNKESRPSDTGLEEI